MSEVLRKRNYRLPDESHATHHGALAAASLVILTLFVLLAVLGHFSPAR